MAEPPRDDLLSDPLLDRAPVIEGFKVLEPAVLYAKVGQGGMGAVYRGRHFKLDLDVAIKCLKPSLAADDPGFVKRFQREARLAASITHQNVVHVMDVHEQHGIHYLVMEFVRGETARERVVRKGRRPRTSGRWGRRSTTCWPARVPCLRPRPWRPVRLPSRPWRPWRGASRSRTSRRCVPSGRTSRTRCTH